MVSRTTVAPGASGYAPETGVDFSASDAFLASFPSLASVEQSARDLQRHRSMAGFGRDTDAGVVWQMSVAPGVIALGTCDWGARVRREANEDPFLTPRLPDESPERMVEALAQRGYIERIQAAFPVEEFPTPYEVARILEGFGAETAAQSAHFWENVYTLVMEFESDDENTARKVRGWSAKSRARMVRRLAELDMSEMYAGGAIPGLVTLTLPAEWQMCAPTGEDFKRSMRKFRRRFERSYWRLQAVWKMEFQRRGAPHLHIQMVPPETAPVGWHLPGCSKSCGIAHAFREWLSQTWADVCLPQDADLRAEYVARGEYDRHVKAGTNVDVREGMRSVDPKRLAVYFSKHGSFSAKEYQHVVPPEWEDGCGRFWGYWNINRASRTVEVRPEIATATARTLRRWSRQQHRTNRGEVPVYAIRRVWRNRVDLDTGEIVGGSHRNSKTRVTRLPNNRGFVVVNDAPALLGQLGRYLDQVASDTSTNRNPRPRRTYETDMRRAP